MHLAYHFLDIQFTHSICVLHEILPTNPTAQREKYTFQIHKTMYFYYIRLMNNVTIICIKYIIKNKGKTYAFLVAEHLIITKE